MALEITEQSNPETATIQGRRNLIEKKLKEDNVSAVVLVGDPGTGKTWMAREISESAQDLCYATLWISVTEDYKIPEESESETMPLQKYKTMPEELLAESMPQDPKAETMPQDPKAETMPQDPKTMSEEPQTETIMQEESKTEIMPEEPKTETIMHEESKTEIMPEELTEVPKTETKSEVHEDSKTEIISEEPITNTLQRAKTMPEEHKTEIIDEVSVIEEYNTKICRLVEEAIAHQILSQSSVDDEWEAENNVKKEEKKQTIAEMVERKLKEVKKAATQKTQKFDLLLILDECGDKTSEDELWKTVWLTVHRSIKDIRLKTIITTRNFKETTPVIPKNPGMVSEVEIPETEIPTPEKIQFGPLSRKESENLFRKCIDREDLDLDTELLNAILEKTKDLPVVITMIAKALKYSTAEQDSCALQRALERAAHYEIAAEYVNPLIHCAYEMLPTDDPIRSCFCHSIQFSSKHGGIHYIELITQWILEGYFDSIHHIKKKYQKGHDVLMKLVDRCMLKIQEDNIIVAEGVALKMIDCLPGFLGKSHLGLAGVSGKIPRTALGRITQIGGMIKTVCDPKKWQEVSTLLIDGDSLRLEVDDELFARMKSLKALAIFNSGLKSLVLSASKSEKQPPAWSAAEPENKSVSENPEPEKLLMKLLVLRGCDLLNGITHIEQLKKLTVLEISGASSLKKIPDRLLDEMIQLQSLNLSGCQMESLASLSKLIKLRILILRECSSLKKLPRINELEYLEVIDLSGATSLNFFPEQDLSRHPQLRMIDLSRTQVKRLPKFGYLRELSRISVEGCKKVRIFPSLQNLGGLKILYLSGVEFLNFHKIKPKVSNTEPLPLIPDTVSELYVRDCPTLKCLPPIAGLKNLEVLDISGASDPEFAITDESFHDLDYLRELNLTNTKLEKLPTLSNLKKLRKLVVENCELLKELPEMNGLENLEVLDLSGCSKLVKLPNLKEFPKLEVLDISNTGIKDVPRQDSQLRNLKVITEKKNRHAYGVFNLAESQTEEKKPSILVNDCEIFQSLQKNPVLKGECIKQISIPSCPPNEQATDQGNRFSIDEVMFSNFYLQPKSFHPYNKDAKFLEIRRLERFFVDHKDILNNIEFISLVEHMSMKSLSDLDEFSLATMKGCWIARCLEMESIFKEEKDAKLVQKLEILWVSNLPKAKELFNQTLNFENLKHLHLDSCSHIKYVFSSSQIPVNLKVLEIKFCDNLETVYKKVDDGPDEYRLSKLQTLLLFDLPELKLIGITMSSNPIIWECPKLKPPPTSVIEVKDGHLKFSGRSTAEIKYEAAKTDLSSSSSGTQAGLQIGT